MLIDNTLNNYTAAVIYNTPFDKWDVAFAYRCYEQAPSHIRVEYSFLDFFVHVTEYYLYTNPIKIPSAVYIAYLYAQSPLSGWDRAVSMKLAVALRKRGHTVDSLSELHRTIRYMIERKRVLR